MTQKNERTPDEYLAAFRADPTNAPLALYAGAALDKAGRHDEALAVWTFGDDANPALRTLHTHPQADDELRSRSQRADEAIRQHFNDLHQKAINQYTDTVKNVDLNRVRRGVWTHYHDSPVNYLTDKQRPVIFYMPDLPAAPVIDNSLLPWANSIEEAYKDILQEYKEASKTNAAMEPYVPAGTPGTEWKKLSGTLDWSAIYLFYNASPTPNKDLFPKTIDAANQADLLTKQGAPVELFFSRLTPGAHIPPHYGLTNTRLTVHLPIIVPEDCAIRVGDEIYKWREGKIVAFDDSYEHEAWNRSTDERVVLIFETHHPDLSSTEKQAIQNIYETFDTWVANRAETIGLAPKA